MLRLLPQSGLTHAQFLDPAAHFVAARVEFPELRLERPAPFPFVVEDALGAGGFVLGIRALSESLVQLAPSRSRGRFMLADPPTHLVRFGGPGGVGLAQRGDLALDTLPLAPFGSSAFFDQLRAVPGVRLPQ